MNRDESHREGHGLSFPPGRSSAADSRTRAAGTPGTRAYCPELRQLSGTSSFCGARAFLFSITYEWQRNCTRRARGLNHPMLRIQREANGEVVLKISGRLDAESLAELKKLIESDETDRRIVLDLRELTLVDQGAVRFLRQCESNGIELKNCPPYIFEWIARQRDGM